MGSITLDDFFTGEPDRCERLIAALQFCTELRSVDEETMSMDSLSSVRVYIIPADDRFDSQHPMISVSSLQNSSIFLAAPRKGSMYRQMIDLSNLHLADQIPLLFSKFSEFGERLASIYIQ